MVHHRMTKRGLHRNLATFGLMLDKPEPEIYSSEADQKLMSARLWLRRGPLRSALVEWIDQDRTRYFAQ